MADPETDRPRSPPRVAPADRSAGPLITEGAAGRPKSATQVPPAPRSGEAAQPEPLSSVSSPADGEPAPLPIPTTRLVPKLRRSWRLFEEGRERVPNASSSPIRVASYDPVPPFIARGKGAYIWDEDDNEYLDFNLAYGVLIHGHAPSEQVKAIQEAVAFGLHFASPTALEIEVAKLFQKLVPNAQRVAFCSNGSDATRNAIRIARAVTGKDAILRFEGHYHGQDDLVLIGAKPPTLAPGADEPAHRLATPAGVPAGMAGQVLVAPFNASAAFEELVRRHRDRLAAVILEPVMANAGVIPPAPEFLAGVVETARQNGVLVIFDEVFTGFRVAPGGAQQLYHVEPDLSCWAKALGGGVPVAAVSGRAEYLDRIAPGQVGFGGTYFANNLSMAGTLANLRMLHRGGPELYARLGHLTEKLAQGLGEAARDAGVDVLVQSVPGMLQFFLTRRTAIANYREALQADGNLYLRHAQLLLDRGIYVHPDYLERITLSTAHTEEDVERFVATAGETFRELRSLPRDPRS